MKHDLIWFGLRFPLDLTPDMARAALTSLAGAPHGAGVRLRVQADQHQVRHLLGVARPQADLILGGLTAGIPSLRADDLPDPSDFRPVSVRLWQPLGRLSALRTDNPAASAAHLLASLQPLASGEVVCLTWTVRPGLRPVFGPTPEMRTTGKAQAIRHKLAGPGLHASGRLEVQAPSDRRRRHLLKRCGAALWGLSTPNGRLVPDQSLAGRLLRVVGLRGSYLSTDELLMVVGWPLESPVLSGLELGASRRLAPHPELARKGRVIGVSDHGRLSRPVALTANASTRGLYLLGPTGTGKTSLIKNLVLDDMKAGRGVAVIETNGDLIADLLDLVPPERAQDVVLLDPTDRSHAVGLNPFRGSDDPALVADQLAELFERLWARSWGPRSSQLAHMALLTLARRPGSTLVDLPRLYLDRTFRAAVLAGLDDPVGLGPDWQWFQGLGEREQALVVAPLLNKIRQFTARPNLRAIVGQPTPAISTRRVLENDLILFAHLPKGLIGTETATLLGSLVLIGLWQAFTERARMSVTERRPFAVFVDEVQDFAAAPVPWSEMFSQGRKYGLAVTVAHQALAQLPPELREVILANARSRVVFSLSPADARAMEPVFAPHLKAADLLALDAHHVAAVLAVDSGGISAPVTLATPPPPEPLGSAAKVRALSRHHYAASRTEVEAALRRSALGVEGPVGRRPRRIAQ